MATTLIHDAEVLVTMDADRRELNDASLLMRDGVITNIGSRGYVCMTVSFISAKNASSDGMCFFT